MQRISTKSSFTLDRISKYDYIQDELNRNYPIVYVISHSVLTVFLSILTIGMQFIFKIRGKENPDAKRDYVIGIYFIFAVIVSLIIIKRRNVFLLQIASLLHIFGFFVALYLIFSSVVVIDMNAYHLILLAIGMSYSILCTIFSIIIFCGFFGVEKERFRYSSQNTSIEPLA